MAVWRGFLTGATVILISAIPFVLVVHLKETRAQQEQPSAAVEEYPYSSGVQIRCRSGYAGSENEEQGEKYPGDDDRNFSSPDHRPPPRHLSANGRCAQQLSA
jgi:hypothetical protein